MIWCSRQLTTPPLPTRSSVSNLEWFLSYTVDPVLYRIAPKEEKKCWTFIAKFINVYYKQPCSQQNAYFIAMVILVDCGIKVC